MGMDKIVKKNISIERDRVTERGRERERKKARRKEIKKKLKLWLCLIFGFCL